MSEPRAKAKEDLAQPDVALDAAPAAPRVEADLAANLTTASGSTGRIHRHAREPNVDYWKRRGVRSLDVIAARGEQRTVELGPN